MGIIYSIIIGGIAGALAKLIMPGKDGGGILMTIVLGVAGSLFMTFIGKAIGWYDAPGEKAGLITSIIGAVVFVCCGGWWAPTTGRWLGIPALMPRAFADVAEARRDYLDESGGRYVHVIADGGVGTSGDIVRAIACGSDAVMLLSLIHI